MFDPHICRVKVTVQGIVQGVGFRPFVYRLARDLRLVGTIVNSHQGVIADLEGRGEELTIFVETLVSTPPPLARISSVTHRYLTDLQGFSDLTILKSLAGQQSATLIPADISFCDDCLQDCLDPQNRRYLYPFTNCTNCGPRFTIVETTPYDRPGTSMKHFPLCSACREEYENPLDRRFHAQPNACLECGPALSFHNSLGIQKVVASPLKEVAKALQGGKIVAMRGLGGFHLVVDASSEKAVQRLRERKGRKHKPLAVMAADLAEAAKHCHVNAEAEAVLQSDERPIVLLRALDTGLLATSLRPGIHELGVMLPYTPMHLLLFQQRDCPQTLVMTSGNRSGLPIFTANEAAIKGLAGIADYFLLHNREIVTRVDDSVVRSSAGGVQILRRSRGYVPGAIAFPWQIPPLLSCGAGLKSTFCLTRDHEAFVSQHIGSLFNLESLDFYRESIYHLKKLLQVEPEAVVCDLHPDYLSSHYAMTLDLPLYRVQHHHAHAAAVLAEHGIEGKVLALILDGSGLGGDNTIWGGEVLEADCMQYKRLASLEPMHLPGGDAAAERPWRMGLSLLYQAKKDMDAATALCAVNKTQGQSLWQMMAQNFNSPLTSSCGRLFDGVAALLGVCLESDYEGQAAMELEALAVVALAGRCFSALLSENTRCATLKTDTEPSRVQQQELVFHVLEQLEQGVARADIALNFHLALIHSFVNVLCVLQKQTGLNKVVLAGGCLQNTLLLQGLTVLLKQKGFVVYTGKQIPVNDGGISLGQAVIGGFAHVSGSTDESC